MDEVLRHVESALRCHPAPAVRLSELLALVRSGLSPRALDARLLRTLLEGHPDRFRILDPWRGPWRTARLSPPLEGGNGDPWVVVVTDPADQNLEASCLAARLRESVRWVGRSIDPRSTRELVRWHALALAERDVRPRVLKRAA
jgi:hypothetical protein